MRRYPQRRYPRFYRPWWHSALAHLAIVLIDLAVLAAVCWFTLHTMEGWR